MIISIDPGINSTAIAVTSVENGNLRVHYTEFINNTKAFTPHQKLQEKKYDSRYVRAVKITDAVERLCDVYDIDAIVTEGAFFNPTRPLAYSTLLEVIYAVKYSVIRNMKIPYTEIPPKKVKQIFHGKGNAKKEDMEAVLKQHLENKTILIDKKMEELTEHEIDSIAVAYSYYKEILKVIK